MWDVCHIIQAHHKSPVAWWLSRALDWCVEDHRIQCLSEAQFFSWSHAHDKLSNLLLSSILLYYRGFMTNLILKN